MKKIFLSTMLSICMIFVLSVSAASGYANGADVSKKYYTIYHRL